MRFELLQAAEALLHGVIQTEQSFAQFRNPETSTIIIVILGRHSNLRKIYALTMVISTAEREKLAIQAARLRKNIFWRALQRLSVGVLCILCTAAHGLAAAFEDQQAADADAAGPVTMRYTGQVERIRLECERDVLWLQPQSTATQVGQVPQSPCVELLDQFHLWLDGAPTPPISDKEAAIVSLEQFLGYVRFAAEAIRERALKRQENFVNVRLSEALLIEHSIRRALSRIRAYETWEASVAVGGGLVKAKDGLRSVAGSRASLRVDLGQSVDGLAELETGTPRKESSGMVELPPASSDLLYISQLWVRTRKLKRMHFWFGVMPDAEDPLVPVRWPFLSLGSNIKLVPDQHWGADLVVRHDVYGIWDAASGLYAPERIERNMSSLGFFYSPHLEAQSAALLRAHMQVHWYADRAGLLRRLSLGRSRELEPDNDVREPFRVVKFDGSGHFEIRRRLVFEPFAAVFWNVESRNDRIGSFVSLSGKFGGSDWSLANRIHLAEFECNSMPPVGLNSNFFPNQRVRGGTLAAGKRVSRTATLNVEILAQQVKLLKARDACPWVSERSTAPHRINGGATVSIIFEFGPAP